MPLFDAYGRPIVFEALREEQAAPTLLGIRNIYSVIDDSIGLTPEKVAGILRTAEYGDPWLYLELAERMEEKDLLYQGVLHTRKMAVSQLDIDVQAAGDDSQSTDDAKFIRDVLIDSSQVDLHDVVFQMLDALGKGFSATEIIWDTDGVNAQTGAPQWLPLALEWRDPRWFMFDWVSGEQLLVRTLSTDGPQLPVGRDAWDSRLSPMNFRVRFGGMGHEIGIQPATSPLAPFKFITHVTRAKAGLPIRGGLARIAIWCYLFKNYVLKDWMVFAEVYGQPMRLGKYGPGATEADKGALLRAVANIGTDAAAIIPESMAIEFVESRGGGQKSHEMYLVKPLIDLNRGPRRRYPQISIGFEEEADLTELMAGLGPAIDRGLRVSEKWLRDQFGAPEPSPGESLLHRAEHTSAVGDSAAPDRNETSTVRNVQK